HARAWDGQLRRALGDGLEIGEILAEDALFELELAGDSQRCRGELDVALLVMKLNLEVILNLGRTTQLIQEIHVPRGAPELAVGNALQPDVFLHLHDVADRSVLDG